MKNLLATLLLVLGAPEALAGLPSVPAPAGNPLTSEKAVLGKILFWDEQLSSDNSIACGSCHRPADGFADPRVGVHPGPDLVFGTPDDRFGSPGVRRYDEEGIPVLDPVFGHGPQVTPRNASTLFGSAYLTELFWDGRVADEFRDPRDDSLVLPSGAALEAQSLEPILDATEMSHPGRDWDDVAATLAQVPPLALATNWPSDVAAAIAASPTYPLLFDDAFGDPTIDPVRIAFALASYQRTLVADDTPWDRFDAGDASALTPQEQSGLAVFQNAGACTACHAAPHFSNLEFRATGVRPAAEDAGRELVTGLTSDRNHFRVPSLRNVGLRPRFMHNGRKTSLSQVLDFYAEENGEVQFPENQDPHMQVISIPEFGRANLLAFLQNGLTDARAANETHPFDRPTLASEQLTAVVEPLPVIEWRVYPNPGTSRVLFEVELQRPELFELVIHDLRGRRVAREVLGELSAGRAHVPFAATGLSAGSYFYTLRSAQRTLSGRFAIRR